MTSKINSLHQSIGDCRQCATVLPLEPRPVVQFSSEAKLLIIGQAPGLKVHQSGTAWDDASGERLRDWLNIDASAFYGSQVALLPMGFCYPGRGKSGDLPPRSECAPKWHPQVLHHLPKLELTVLVGLYSQSYYLLDKQSLTARVKNAKDYLPTYLPLPHPSPRNNIWLKKNPWFEQDVLPLLRQTVEQLGISRSLDKAT